MLPRRLLLWLSIGLLPLGAQPAASQSRHLTILHSNDLHAHISTFSSGEGNAGIGGFARLATAVERERANCAACLYLNAGDLVQGTPVSTIYKGLPVYQIANRLGFDAAVVGNHEFDYGWRQIQKFARVATYPLLSANIVDAQGRPLTGKSYVILNAGGIRIAVIGVVLGDLVGNSITPEEAGPYRVLPVVETVRKYAQELRDRSDLIVVLGHLHDDTEVRAILQQVPEVSVVIAGHTHIAYPQMMNVDGRVAVLVDAFGAQLGRLDLQVDMAAKKATSAEWKKIPIDASVPEDPQVAREVARWEGKVSKIVDVPIGEATRRLAGADLRSTLKTAIAAAVHADFVFLDTGSTRDLIRQGKIMARAIWNMLPFDDDIVIGKFKGSQLPAVVTNGQSIDPDREYTLATTDFTAINQSSPRELGTHDLVFSKSGPLERDLVIDWIKRKRVIP